MAHVPSPSTVTSGPSVPRFRLRITFSGCSGPGIKAPQSYGDGVGALSTPDDLGGRPSPSLFETVVLVAAPPGRVEPVDHRSDQTCSNPLQLLTGVTDVATCALGSVHHEKHRVDQGREHDRIGYCENGSSIDEDQIGPMSKPPEHLAHLSGCQQLVMARGEGATGQDAEAGNS